MAVNTIRIRLGHESLYVTRACPKGKDAESDGSAGTCEQQQPGAVRLTSVDHYSGRSLATKRGSPVLISLRFRVLPVTHQV
jgi:hypothetical protein